MNALKHGLTGNRLLLQSHELETYKHLSIELNKELNPKTELERQLVQKIIDCHTRLNRIAALEGNILNIGVIDNETSAGHDDALETIAAQARSWIENANSFEKLGRYEARISRQLLQYTRELEHLQALRHQREYELPHIKNEKLTKTAEQPAVKPKSASLCISTQWIPSDPAEDPSPNLRQ
jgi:hypothetical protein